MTAVAPSKVTQATVIPSTVTASTLSTPIVPETVITYQQRLRGFLFGALAACGAVTITNPFEVVKTRLQLQGEIEALTLSEKTTTEAILLQQRVYKNPISALILIGRQEGLRGLQKGIVPAYGYQIAMNGTRLGLYEPIRDNLQAALNYFTAREDQPMVPIMIASGALSGFTGAFVGSPLFLIKTRMQAYSAALPSVGHQHAYTTQGTVKGLLSIYKAEGIMGVWRGAGMAMMRTGVGSSVQLSSYDLNKKLLLSTKYLEDGTVLHFAASLLTSLAVVIVMNPFDVASTRIYNQKSTSDGTKGILYNNGLDCLIKTIKGEGILALYKGTMANYLRIGPHTIFTFVFLEQLRSIARWWDDKYGNNKS